MLELELELELALVLELELELVLVLELVLPPPVCHEARLLSHQHHRHLRAQLQHHEQDVQ